MNSLDHYHLDTSDWAAADHRVWETRFKRRQLFLYTWKSLCLFCRVWYNQLLATVHTVHSTRPSHKEDNQNKDISLLLSWHASDLSWKSLMHLRFKNFLKTISVFNVKTKLRFDHSPREFSIVFLWDCYSCTGDNLKESVLLDRNLSKVKVPKII